jgi:hypothetical protein
LCVPLTNANTTFAILAFAMLLHRSCATIDAMFGRRYT